MKVDIGDIPAGEQIIVEIRLYARPILTSPDTSRESKKLISAARIALVALSQADCRCSSTAFTRTICSRCTALADLRGAGIS